MGHVKMQIENGLQTLGRISQGKKKKNKNHTRHEAGPGEGKRSEALVGAK